MGNKELPQTLAEPTPRCLLTLFLLYTGLRLSEAIGLRMTDLELSERKGSISVQNGKGNKQRNVPLNSDARKALQEWIKA